MIATVNQLLAKGALRLVVALRSEVAEQNIKQLLLDRYPRHLLGAIPFLVSSELAHDSDLARRTITAVVNSYLHAGMEHFLYGAENICKEQHLKRPLLIFRNDGDSARVAKTTAIKTWGSGPRGGLEGAVAYARHYGLDDVVTMDIGGTTTDISVVTGQAVTMLAYGAIEGTPTSFPLPTIHSFGVGGSSVVRVTDDSIKIGRTASAHPRGRPVMGRGGHRSHADRRAARHGVFWIPKDTSAANLPWTANAPSRPWSTMLGKRSRKMQRRRRQRSSKRFRQRSGKR